MRFSVYCLLALAGWLTLVSCNPLRNEVTSSPWQPTQIPLAITCFLSPQDVVLVVKVSQITPIIGDQSGPPTEVLVPDASVRLSQGSQSVVLTYDAKRGIYQCPARSLPIRVGQTYELAVYTSTGQLATSRCVIPQPVALTQTIFDSTSSQQLGRLITRYFVEAHWQEPTDGLHYYQVTGLLRFVRKADPAAPAVGEEVSYLQFDRPEDEYIAYSQEKSGSMKAGPAYLSSPSTSPDQAVGFDNYYNRAKVVMNLLHTTAAYYQYQQAVARQLQTTRNPFAEPVPIPSNIDGAVGCFGAYNRSTGVILLK
jgi:hypothetical protein